MHHLHLSDVQTINLQLLYAIRLGMERDLVGTCHKFYLDSAQAERIRGIRPEALVCLVQAMGQTSLFVPRSDILSLLDAPVALAGTWAAVHPPSPAPVSIKQ